MKKAYIPFAAVIVALLLTAPALAQVPNLLNYQGRLTDPSGNPKNGTFTMQFAVYDAETGGNQLPTGSPWSETQSVTVTNGVFNVLLGSVTPLPTNVFEGGPSDASGPLRFLKVTVTGEVLTPRRRIASAAYAITSVGTTTSALQVASGIAAWPGSGVVVTGFQPKVITVSLSVKSDTSIGFSHGNASGSPVTQSSIFGCSPGGGAPAITGSSTSYAAFVSGQVSGPNCFPTASAFGARLEITEISSTGFSYTHPAEDQGALVTGMFEWTAYGQ